MEIEGDIIDTIENKQLSWYGHLRRMNSNRWPQKLWNWVSPERKKRGIPQRTWINGINNAMQIKQLLDHGWEDRKHGS